MASDSERRPLLLASLTSVPLIVGLVAVGGAAGAVDAAPVRQGAPPAVLGAPALVPQLPPPALGPAVPAAGRRAQGQDLPRASRSLRRPKVVASAPPAAPAPAPPRRARPAGGLDAAVARLPGYRPGSARWVSRAFRGHWGATDWHSGTIYISPRTPPARLYSVVTHEWSHLLQVRAYDGDVQAAVRAMNRHFGGTGMVGAERAADCMALLQGATWTHYTSCPRSSWRRGAALLLEGRQL